MIRRGSAWGERPADRQRDRRVILAETVSSSCIAGSLGATSKCSPISTNKAELPTNPHAQTAELSTHTSKSSLEQTACTVKKKAVKHAITTPNQTTCSVHSKILNVVITKNRKLNIFQTVNHSRIIWDPKLKPRGVLGGHLNIRSFKSKRDQIHQLLLDSNLDFLCLTETWLNENSPSSALHVPGYKVHREDRVGSKGGGDLIFVKDRFQCHEVQWSCNELECIGLNITLSPSMSFSLITLYRPPSSKNTFYEHFENMLKECNFNKEVIIIGDFNINWEDKASRKTLKQITDDFDLKQLINGPTRVTNSTRTQIDLIFSNRPKRIVKSFNMLTGLSDHNMILIARKLTNKRFTPFVQEQESLNIPKKMQGQFISAIQSINWYNILSGRSLEEDSQRFTQQLQRSIDTFTRTQRHKRKKRTPFFG